MHKVTLVAISLMWTSASGAGIPSERAQAATRNFNLCAARPAGFFTLAAELNRMQGCVAAACFGSWSNIENKELAGYTLNDWLWTGPTPKNFSSAEESAFRAAAQARALAARPAGKTLISITYFTDFIVPNQGGAYFLGARAYYGVCLRGQRQTPR
jgi:hypothetical protein